MGDKFSPGLSPFLHSKKSDDLPLNDTHDLILAYMFLITVNIFLDTLASYQLLPQSDAPNTVEILFGNQ